MHRAAPEGETDMKSTLGKLLIACTLLGTGQVAADSLQRSALEQLFEEPVTTSATGSPQRASQVAATMIIITADDIRRSGARDIPGILKHVAGVDVMQTSNDYADIAVRGYNQAFSPRLLVLVDGRQVYADYYGFTPWSTVPVELDAIRQIEVVKGPNSALFGFNAVGGVINIVTHDLEDDINSVTISAGTQGLRQASATSAWQFSESAGLRLSAGHREGEDFETKLRPDEAGVRRGNERNSISLRVDWRGADNLQAGMAATYSSAKQPELIPVYTMSYDDYEASSLLSYVALDTRLGLIEGRAYRNRITSDVFPGSSPEIWLTIENQVTVAQLQSVSKVASRHTLRLLAEYRNNTMKTTPFPGGDVEYDVIALGGMWEWQAAPSLTITTAIRVDHWTLGRSGDFPAGFPLTNDDWDRSQNEPSFNVALVWQAGAADTFRILAGRGVQLPNLVNLGGLLLPMSPGQFAGGVPYLDPTIVDNVEVSWDRNLALSGTVLRVSAFHGRSRDILAVTGESQPSLGLVGLPFNIGESATDGVEVALEGKIREEWRWGFSYRGQRIDDDFRPGASVAQTLTDFENTAPQHLIKANVGWARDRWEIDAFARYQSHTSGIIAGFLTPDSGQLVPVPAYVAVDGRLAYAVSDRITLALSGQNLTHSQQRQTSAPDVERSVFATFVMDFGSSE